MEFKLEDFTISPTEDKLNRCKKDDLILIANFFDVPVPLDVKRKELKELVCAKLCEGVCLVSQLLQRELTWELSQVFLPHWKISLLKLIFC